MRPRLAASLVLASTAGLLACPQLLSDDFGALQNTGDDTCVRRQTCAAGAGGSSGASGAAAGSGGTSSGAGGSTPNAGSSGAAGAGGSGGAGQAGSGGSAGTGGIGGTSGSGGSGGSDPADASTDPPEPPACWFVELDDTTHEASSNCLGINGWNQVVTDTESEDTVVSLTYEDGAACFTGTITTDGWAVYNFTINDTAPWGGQGAEVGGFQFDATGTSLPPEISIKYQDVDDGEFCRLIIPGAGVQVPFASAHPGCSTSSSSIPDATDLTFIRFAMDPSDDDYAVDFCLTIRAIP